MQMLTAADNRRHFMEQNTILRRGSADERRRLLRMRQLPLPADIDAVAVPGTAIIDIPEQHHSLENDRRRTVRAAFDPLQHIADRYGGAHADNDNQEDDGNTACVNYAAFLDVLCPNGTSLLEHLPISPVETRRQHRGGTGGSPCSGHDTTVQRTKCASPSPRHRCVTRSPSPVDRIQPTAASTAYFFATPLSDALPPGQQDEGRNETKSSYVDAPISFQAEAAASESGATASPAYRDEHSGAEDVEEVPTIFVSAGFLSLAAPHTSSRRRKSSKLTRHPSPASPQHSFGSVDHATSMSRCDLTSPVGGPLHSATPKSAPLTPLGAREMCDLSGRVLLTDRLVMSQAHTNLPKMIQAYAQYVQATAACSEALPSPSSASSHHGRTAKTSSNEEMAAAQQRLAPRQRGIVLQSSDVSEEVLKCVARARQRAQPSFRCIDPVELYGASSYTSDTLMKRS